MKTRTKKAGALASTLAAGAVAGGLLFSPIVSSAQDGSTTTTPDTTQEAGDRADRREERRAKREERRADLAEVLGITTDELRQAHEDGQSLAEIAAANGVDRQVVVDHIVAEQTARLEARIAELPDRIGALVDGELPPHGEHGPGGGGPHGPPAGAPPADGGATEGGG